MKKNTVSSRLDLNKLPPLTPAQQAELEALKDLQDEDIDLSDVPELDVESFAKAIRNPYLKAPKESTTVRIDKDVMDWLRSCGPGYQTRINTYLRLAMVHSLRAENSNDPRR